MRKSVVAVLALVAILSWFNLSASGQRVAESAARQQWEYMFVSKALGEFTSTTVPPWLEQHGKEGWELCDVIQHAQVRQFVFKRSKS